MLCEGTKGLRRKIWTQTKLLSPNIRYFVAILRFVAIYTLFWKSLGKNVLSKTVFLVQEMHFDMVCIAYYTELNLQLCAKRCICCGKSKYALDESFYGHFCPRRKAGNFFQPGDDVCKVIPRRDEDGDSEKTRNDHCKRTRATSLLSKYVCNICHEMILFPK